MSVTGVSMSEVITLTSSYVSFPMMLPIHVPGEMAGGAHSRVSCEEAPARVFRYAKDLEEDYFEVENGGSDPIAKRMRLSHGSILQL